MFTFVEDETGLEFEQKVTVNHPANGRMTFTCTFELVEQDEFSGLSAQGDAALLKRVTKGWGKDVCASDGEPLPFSDATLAAMLRRPYVRTAMMQAYINGVQGFRLGN